MAPLGQALRSMLSFRKKASATHNLPHPLGQVTWLGAGKASWTSRGYAALSREAYSKNVIAHRSIKMVAECGATIPLRVSRDRTTLQSSALQSLFAQPNHMQDGVSFLENLCGFLQLAGNVYIELVQGADGAPTELHLLRPDRMTVVPGSSGWPIAYEYKIGGRTHRFPIDPVSGQSNILHIKTFNPLDDHYGMSSLEAAAQSIDLHNAASDWNKALLDNAARPSGALIFDPGDGQSSSLSDDQVKRLKAEMQEQFQGHDNAGRPFLLEGGLKWQQVALSPADMDFLNCKNVSAREIALAFGVPTMLLGIPGDNTYSNYLEANRALWRLTVIPLMRKIVTALGGWLLPHYGEGFSLEIDLDAIPALAVEREKLWTRLDGASFLTVNEKRRAVGLKPISGGDSFNAGSGGKS